MSDENAARSEIEDAWLSFAKSARSVFEIQLDDRALDQYLEFRDRVFSLIEGEKFCASLREALQPQPDNRMPPDKMIVEALMLELRAFPRAVEVAVATEGQPIKAKVPDNRWISRAKTVAGSVSDILENLPPYAKAALTLFKELCALFDGRS